jgi:hypothetical protein
LAMMINAPEKMPAPPMPAIARPTMRATELGLAPQIAEPTSNVARALINVHLIGSRV